MYIWARCPSHRRTRELTNCSLTKCTCKQTNFVFSCILGGSPDGAKLKLYAQAFKHHLGELKDKDCMIMGLQKVVF